MFSFANILSLVADPTVLVGAGLVLAVIYITIYILYQLFISTLSTIPGPFWAKITPFWLTLQCRRTNRSEAIAAIHKTYGPVVRITPNHISINSPQALAQIYGHKSGFTKGPFYDAFFQVRPVVFTARDVVAHQRKRKYLNPAFSARGLGDFEPYMDVEIREWKGQLMRFATDRKEVDFCVWTNYLAFDVIGSFAFGRSFDFSARGHDRYNLIQTIDTRGEVLNALGTIPPALRRWMKYNVFDLFWARGLRARADLEKIGRDAFLQRKSDTKKQHLESSRRRDLLSFLFQAIDPDSGRKLPDEEIVAESISFIVGGSDTTSSTMTNFIDLVCRTPGLQRRLQTELDEAFPDVNGKHDWVAPNKVLENLPLLNATLKEVMRYRPTSAAGLERITPAGGKVIDGVFLPAGTLVSVPTMGVLHDENIFPHPDEFDPDRWLTSDISRQSQMMEFFQPFSTGPRSCIGRNFAWMEILKAMATLFRLSHLTRTSSESTVIREGFFNKAVECMVRIERR